MLLLLLLSLLNHRHRSKGERVKFVSLHLIWNTKIKVQSFLKILISYLFLSLLNHRHRSKGERVKFVSLHQIWNTKKGLFHVSAFFTCRPFFNLSAFSCVGLFVCRPFCTVGFLGVGLFSCRPFSCRLFRPVPLQSNSRGNYEK